MKKLLALLLALTMAVSLFALGVSAEEDTTPPTIVSAVAINDTQFKITTSEPIIVAPASAATFALQVLEGGVLQHLTDFRHGGTIAPVDEFASEFTWTIDSGKNATTIINTALAEGKTVRFAINGKLVNGQVDPSRAKDAGDNGFAPNIETAVGVSHALYGIEVTAYTPNVITSVKALNHKQIKFTTQKPIIVPESSKTTFALFVAKNGVVESFTYRYGGTIDVVGTLATEFIWTIDTGKNATTIINDAVAAGNTVYFGINGENKNGQVDPGRAKDEYGNGFVPNVNDKHDSHDIYGVEVSAYKPNTITSVKLITNTQIEIEFATPVTSSTDALFLCLLDSNGVMQNSDPDSNLDNHTPLNVTEVEGKLLCELKTDHPGLSEDRKNIIKFIAEAKKVYPDYVAGVTFLEATDEAINNSGLMENTVDAEGIALGATGLWPNSSRDTSTAAIAFGVAKMNGTYYFTLDDAVEAAKAGDTIVLMDNVTVADPFFILDAGVTLDLSGYTLTVENYLLPYGTVMDSAVENKGKLVVDADKVLGSDLDSEEYMPLYNDAVGGYQFYKYTFRHVERNTNNDDTVMYSVGLKFDNDEAFTLLSGKKFGVKMTIDKADANFTQDITWIFSEKLMNDFIAKNTDDDGVKNAITLTVYGVKAIGKDCISTQAVLYSMDGTLNLECAMDEPVA